MAGSLLTSLTEKWTPKELPDLSNLHVMVTGANSGIGFETSRQLALKNAHVYMVGRNPQKGTRAVNSIQREMSTSADRVQWMTCDFSEMKNVEALAAEVEKKDIPLNRLALIAGQFLPPHEVTQDGLEIHHAVNYYSQFLLAHLLLERLHKNAPSRIALMGSTYHNIGVLDWDDLRGVSSGNSDLPQYATANLYKIMVAQEMARRLRSKGVYNVDVMAMHPGLADTPLFSKTDTDKATSWINKAADALTGKDAEIAAYSSIFAIAEPSIEGESFKYYGPTGVGFGPLQTDHTGERTPHNPYAQDESAIYRLYDESANLMEKILGKPLPNRL